MKSTPLLDTPSACPGMLSPSGTFIRKQEFSDWVEIYCSQIRIIFTSWETWNDSLKSRFCFSSAEFSILAITCSTIDARRPSARPHSSPRVTTALPSFTTILLACFSSLRWAKDLPCIRLRGTVIKGMLLQERTCLMAEGWTRPAAPEQSQMQEKKERNTQYNFSLKICMQNSNQFGRQKIALSFLTA